MFVVLSISFVAAQTPAAPDKVPARAHAAMEAASKREKDGKREK
jgi:hypothetical protein